MRRIFEKLFGNPPRAKAAPNPPPTQEPDPARKRKADAFVAKMVPLLDPSHKDYLSSVHNLAQRYVDGLMTTEMFDRMTTHEIEKFQPMDEADIARLLEANRKPQILLLKTPSRDAPGAPGCWLGGQPTLPSDIAWPWFIHKGDPLVPMHFMAQINLAEMPRSKGFPDLPATGTLFFFLPKHAYWLLDGGPESGEPGCRVIYVAHDVSTCPEREMPAMPDLSAQPWADEWYANYANLDPGPLKRWNVTFHPYDIVMGKAPNNAAYSQALGNANLATEDSLRRITAAQMGLDPQSDDIDYLAFPIHRLLHFNHHQDQTPRFALSIEPDADIGYDEDVEAIELAFAGVEPDGTIDLRKTRPSVTNT